jgi:hypothetical protein
MEEHKKEAVSILEPVLAGSLPSLQMLSYSCLHKGPGFLMLAEYHFSYSHWSMEKIPCI